MLTNSLLSEIPATALPKYIVIEGPIGVGKTTLAKRLAETFNYDILLEAPEQNPFLKTFYEAPEKAALQTQLFFLFQRAQQLQQLNQDDLFHPVKVADFLIEKDRLFAQLTLSEEEFELYDKVYQHLDLHAPTPDLVIYLQAPVNVLLERIQKRGIPHERLIEAQYLHQLNDGYAQFFHYYDEAPTMIVNASEIDLVNHDADYENLVKAMLTVKNGRHYFNPEPIAL